MLLAFFGGLYSNHLALAAAIRDAQGRGAERMFCLGDMGAFGPHPDRVFPLLHEHRVECIQGNYDHSIGNDLRDCQCGYTDPRDNHFAQISYDYTFEHTSPANRHWLKQLPRELRFEVDGLRFLLCHGSPRRTNEFLWESTTSTQFLNRLADDCAADVILGTHTGIHWMREWGSRKSRGERREGKGEGEGEGREQRAESRDQTERRFINVGVLGRPENDGRTNVWYALVRTGNDATAVAAHSASVRASGCPDATIRGMSVEFVPLEYDYQRLAREMREERLPEEFVETILTGWWTTCLEVLPAKERRRGRF
jgi:predicted phosphodiesterase